jgi:hypothetical protein
MVDEEHGLVYGLFMATIASEHMTVPIPELI